MKKVFTLMLAVAISLCFCSCIKKSDKIFKYNEDRTSGYSKMKYYGEDWDSDNHELYESQKRNGDYITTYFEDGICINKYIGTDKNVAIPAMIANKPVIKIGEYYFEDEYDGKFINTSFAFENVDSITIPSTVKYIAWAYPSVKSIVVDAKNPYYASKDGILYSKDMSCLLCMPKGYSANSFSIPDFVEYVADIGSEECIEINVPQNVVSIGFETDDATVRYSNLLYYVSKDNQYYSSDKGVLYDKQMTTLLCYPIYNTDSEYKVPNSVTKILGTENNLISIVFGNIQALSFGKNIKEIDLGVQEWIRAQEDGAPQLSLTTIKGYKGTVAESFAKENNLEFVPLD